MKLHFFIFICFFLHIPSHLLPYEILTDSDVLLLKKRIESPPSLWMQEQIEHDLRPFYEKGISQEMLDFTFFNVPGGPKSRPICRLQLLSDGTLHISEHSGRGPKTFSVVIEELHQIVGLPPFDILLYVHDGCGAFFNENPFNTLNEHLTHKRGWLGNSENFDSFAPIFAFAKFRDVEKVILIPDHASLLLHSKTGTYNWKYNVIPAVLKANNEIPWEKKIEKIFWRGSTTGGIYTEENWKKFPRAKVALLSKQYPNLIDASFNSIVQCTNEAKATIIAEGLTGETASIETQIPYKYQIAIDGNVCSYPGFQWRLLSNSVVFKLESKHAQWFSSALRPYEHYIPVRDDASDLLQKLDWAMKNDHQCKRIADNATQFVKENLFPADIYAYLYFLLVEYSKLQTFEAHEIIPK